MVNPYKTKVRYTDSVINQWKKNFLTSSNDDVINKLQTLIEVNGKANSGVKELIEFANGLLHVRNTYGNVGPIPAIYNIECYEHVR